ncbi:hypothetical protein H2201_006759 [Coniosporium apollinis]|uniref:Glycosyl transferase CAP10 domain-containing protein n=1 Tax=Coniosporium apollinis TaxID=61459 RepID=A0ABQ9NR93_9PEZI|nr:hypothetical protein H2201_006759 [Coniosporium apollinis]
MALWRSHQVTIVTVFIVAVIIFFVGVYYNSPYRWTYSQAYPKPAANGALSWTFDPARDSRRYGLNQSQCDAAFAKLWLELDRAAHHQDKTGKIMPEEHGISWSRQGTVRAMIHNHQVKGCTRSDFRERSNAILHSIHRALIAYPDPVPNIEFSFNIEDIPNDDETPTGTTWALTRRKDQQHLWLMPDFGYWSWFGGVVGSYERVLDKIAEGKRLFMEKDQRVVWRGAGLNEQRKTLLEVSKGRAWADIESIVWDDDPDKRKEMLPIHDHCRYMFVIHTEGRSYSGRLKYLLNCGSVVIIPEPLTWVEYFHHLLIPDGPRQNYVSVKADFSDLEEKINYYLSHLDEAQRIADNSVTTFRERYLTPAAQACYWRKLFEVWAAHSSEPEMYRKGEEKKWRGIPFETYM